MNDRVFNWTVDRIAALPENTPWERRQLYDSMRARVAAGTEAQKAIIEDVIARVESMYEVNRVADGRTRKWLPWAAAAVVAVISAGGAAAYLMRGSTNAEFDRGIAGYTFNVNTLEQIGSDARYAVAGDDSEAVLVATGHAPLYQVYEYQVDPSKVYEVSARVRAVEGHPKTFVGVVTYDKDGKVLKSDPGEHRYAAAINRVLEPEEGWVELKGRITGEGDENHNQFRPGTAKIRLVALLNYQAKEEDRTVTEIDFLRLNEVK